VSPHPKLKPMFSFQQATFAWLFSSVPLLSLIYIALHGFLSHNLSLRSHCLVPFVVMIF
jgi:hypothetical protein